MKSFTKIFKKTTGEGLVLVGTVTNASGYALLLTVGIGSALSLLGAPWPTVIILSFVSGLGIFQIKGGSILADLGTELIQESKSYDYGGDIESGYSST